MAEEEAADDGDSERATELAADALAEREGERAEQRGHGRHDDRTEAQKAGFTDGVDGAYVVGVWAGNADGSPMVDVSGGHTAKTDRFKFVKEFLGLEHFPKGGTVIANDGDEPVVTPHDDCYLVMPNHRAKKGDRVLRFARPSA